MAFGGDIQEVTFNNSSVGSGIFKPKAGEANTFDPGGIRVADDSGSITSDGQPIWTQNQKMGGFQILIANDMNTRRDIEKMAQLAGSATPTQWTVTLKNGTIWRGAGYIVGDIAADTDKATVPMKVAVPQWKQI